MPQDHLDELERVIARNSRWVTGLLILFALLVIGGTTLLYVRVQRFLQPEALASAAISRLEDNYPEIRQAVKQRLVAAAPSLADRASQEVLKSMPEARAELQAYLEQQMDTGLDRAARLSAEQFRKFLRENRADIKKAFREVEENPRESPRLAADLDQLVEQRLGVNVQQEARLVLDLLRKLNAKLEAIRRPPSQLTATQEVERRIVRILRTVQVREVGKLKH